MIILCNTGNPKKKNSEFDSKLNEIEMEKENIV